jgi:hypothetical protein
MRSGFTIFLNGEEDLTEVARSLVERMRGQEREIEFFSPVSLFNNKALNGKHFLQNPVELAEIVAFICALLNKFGVDCVIHNLFHKEIEAGALRKGIKDAVEVQFLTQEAKKIKDTSKAELIFDIFPIQTGSTVDKIMNKLEELAYLEFKGSDYTEAEKKEVDDRLKSLGYM